MKEYIEREALGKAYVDLCLAKSRLAKSRKGAAFLYGGLLPEEEPTVKELFGLINAAPAADVVERKRGEWVKYETDDTWGSGGFNYWYKCSECGKDANGRVRRDEWYSRPILSDFCPNCGSQNREVKHEP